MTDGRRPPLRRELAMLDARLALITDSEELVRRVDAELGRFLVQGVESPTPLEVRFSPSPPRAAVHGETFLLAPGAAVDQAFALLFRAALDETVRFVVLHAAALERAGRVLLIAGPSESGKTTLALALLRRGFRLLSDDFTPLERSSGLVVPFLKALGIRPGPGHRLADIAPEARREGRVPFDAGGLPDGSLAAEAARPAAIVLCDGGERPADPRAPFLFGVTTTGPVRELAAKLAMPGVELCEQAPGRLVVRLEPARLDPRRLDVILEEDPHVLEYGLVPSSFERRRAAPRLLPMRARDALLLLLRDVQNRRPGGALLASLDDDPSRLALELARLVGSLPCAWLVAGEPEPTAARLLAWFDQLGSAPAVFDEPSEAAPGSTSIT